MITDAVISTAAVIVEWFLGLLPVVPVPSWVGTVTSGFALMFGYVNSMGAWLPTGLLFTVAGTVLACVLGGLLIKVLRSLLSYFLAGGGSSG